MKEYIKQFYNEGLATTFYLKSLKLVSKIKNKKLVKIISFLIKLLYTILAIILAIYMFNWRFPL